MTAADLIELFRQKGVSARADGATLRLRPASRLTPEDIEAIRANKAELLALLRPAPTPVPALRQALRQWYALTTREADGNLPTPEEARTLLSEIRRLWDNTGPAFAEAVHRQEALTYYQRTSRCPTCGQRGVFHAPEG